MSLTYDELKANILSSKKFDVYVPADPDNLTAIKRSAIPSSSLYWNCTGLVKRVAPPPPRLPPGHNPTSRVKQAEGSSPVEAEEEVVVVKQPEPSEKLPIEPASPRPLPALPPVGKRDEEWRVHLEPWTLKTPGHGKPVSRMVACGMVSSFAERHPSHWNTLKRGDKATAEELALTGCAASDEMLYSQLNDQMQTVRLEGCGCLTADALARLGSACPGLSALCLEATAAVDDSVLSCIANGCKELQVLKIDGCELVTDSGVACLQECESLVRCSVARLPLLTGESFWRFSKKLREIDLSDCPLVTDAALLSLCERCKGLEVLSLKRCTNVGDVGLRSVYSNCTQLRGLSISGCINVTGRSLMQLASKLPFLITLEVGSIQSFDDGILATFARGCRHLERLDCRQCCALSNMALTSLANNCLVLSHLSLAGCPNISNDGLNTLAEGLRYLVFVNVHGCSGILPEELARFVKIRPLVEVKGNVPVQKKFHWTDLIGKEKAAAAPVKAKKGKKKGKKKK